MKAELVAIVPENMFRTNVQKLTWPHIMDIMHKLPDHILDMIHRATEQKDEEHEKECENKAERKRIARKLQCEAQRSMIEEADVEERNDGVNDHDHSKYLGLPSEEDVKKCFQAYISVTSNKALAMSICFVCVRELMSSEGAQQQLWER